jgi:hypothetical protein
MNHSDPLQGAGITRDPLCPVCEKPVPGSFLCRTSVPVHQHLLFDTPEEARAILRGTLDLRACRRCDFVFNAAFDPRLLSYGTSYDNSQAHSPTFAGYMDDLIRCLVEEHGVRSGRVVEIGCGKGVFLTRLLSHPDNRSEGIGFDPTYSGPESDLGGRVRFVRRFYTPETAVPADVIVCRHVIEHVARPLDLLRAIRASLGSARTRVFFETPCVEWILRRQVAWDFFYEHCSLFSRHSLGESLTQAGFCVTALRHTFGGQYLWAEARAEPGTWPAEIGAVGELAAAFARHHPERVAGWFGVLQQIRALGTVAVWGAGAKGVTFCNLIDPRAEQLAGVVDVNPKKQGRYLAGTSHRILAPRQVAAEGLAAVLVLNPNYVPEITDTLERLECPARVIDLMEEEACAALGR